MSEEIIKLKIITRDEAIDNAATFLRTNSSPNIIKSTTHFNKGVAGIIMFSGDATKETVKAKEHAYFPMYKEQGCEEILLNDVIDFVYFYDRVPDNILYGHDINMCVNYIIDEGICGIVPDILFEQSRTVGRCISKIKLNTDKFYATFFNDVMDKLIRNNSKTTTPEKKDEKTLTPFKFITEAIELPVYDRLGVINFYDNNNIIVVKDEDYFLLVVLSENKYIKIHRTMMKYNSIKAIFEECVWQLKK